MAISQLQAAYDVVGAATLEELYSKYMELDITQGLDPDNPQLIRNQIKAQLDAVDLIALELGDRRYVMEILCFWYGGAVEAALMKGDIERAQKFACALLAHQSSGYLNTIARVWFFLVHNNLAAAKLVVAGAIEPIELRDVRALVKEFTDAGGTIEAYCKHLKAEKAESVRSS